MYYPCSENKGADQFRSYREADLQLCFCLCKLLVFSCSGSIINNSTYKIFLKHRGKYANASYCSFVAKINYTIFKMEVVTFIHTKTCIEFVSLLHILKCTNKHFRFCVIMTFKHSEKLMKMSRPYL